MRAFVGADPPVAHKRPEGALVCRVDEHVDPY